ncbi:MAG: hypothetical protein ACON4N_14755, partial [Myxococcota bacterium]
IILRRPAFGTLFDCTTLRTSVYGPTNDGTNATTTVDDTTIDDTTATTGAGTTIAGITVATTAVVIPIRLLGAPARIVVRSDVSMRSQHGRVVTL